MTETSAPPTPVLGFADGSLLRDGRPHRLLSGSVHYFRVHPAQWRDRLERLRALGLNTVDTYVPWNFHERRPGERRWSGRHDFEQFVGIAGELGIDAGLVLYEAHPVVPRGGATLTIRGLRDRALVFVDGRRIAVLDAEGALEGIPLEGRGASVRLEIVVENQGRINYGPLLGEGKGILGGVLLDRRLVQRWSARPLQLEEWDAATLARLTGGAGSVEASGAGFATASLTVLEPGDAFLTFPGFGKGFVWVNGFLLGRYWEVGPQVTYYLPGPLLHAGENTITVLELERFGDSIEVRERAELGPEEEYVETFD